MSLFIDHEHIEVCLKRNVNPTFEEIETICNKATALSGLTHDEVAKLLHATDEKSLDKIYHAAGHIKNKIYGNRVVVFAPLYISNHCVNTCTYCGFQVDNHLCRRRLSKSEIEDEVRILERMGHKRIALEAGEDPSQCPIEYVLDSMDTIYNTSEAQGRIRRINVNIAATTVENYKKLHEKGIGTYILFQETYHKPSYAFHHKKGPKSNYEYHLTAFDRAQEAGIDDVGGGVLFGLHDYKFEVLALMLHNDHLEKQWNVGFHTISVPRLKKAEGMDLSQYPHLVDDETFKKIVAVVRLAVPFTGIILSTRESMAMRNEVIDYGVSQISAGSCTGVGGYKESEVYEKDISQFQTEDGRSPLEVVKGLIDDGYIPSYCTACYRSGRTGDRFMKLAKSGQIANVCNPNALMTLMEFVCDYGDNTLKEKGKETIYAEAKRIQRQNIKDLTLRNLEKIENGQRDLFL